jgi:hypothetical protein
MKLKAVEAFQRVINEKSRIRFIYCEKFVRRRRNKKWPRN